MSDQVGITGIITGAASGIGEATAARFARTGAQLVLVGTQEDDMSSVVSLVRDSGGVALATIADVRDSEAMGTVAALAIEEFGRIDLVFANAGIADQSHIDDGDTARWRAVVDTNVLGVMYTVRAAAPYMKTQGHGHLIITSSTSGRESYVGEPAYIASKWGLVGLGHALRKELAPYGVRVTLIEPGLVATPLTVGNPKLQTLLGISEALSADDVASAVVFAYTQPRHVLVSELTIRPLREVDTDFDWDR